jgi:hypothetical protein
MSCSKAITTISLAEIIHGGDASVRVTHDSFIYAVDLVMVVSGLERNQAGLSLRRVIDKNLLSINLIERNTGGKGNSRTQLVNLKDALQLVMVLPGEMAKSVRVQISNIMTDFFKGSESLVDQIRVNAASNSPICQLARASGGSVEDQEARRKRVKREDLELVKLEHEIQDMRVKNFQNGMAIMTQIRPDWMQTDARFRMQIEDMARNIMTTPVLAQRLTNGEQTGESESNKASLSISQLAQELGCKRMLHAHMCSAGSRAAKLFRTRYGQDPPKHRQWVDGCERLVNSYTEADRGLLTEVLTDLGLMPGSEPSGSSIASDD